jgi:hypothetical protein
MKLEIQSADSRVLIERKRKALAELARTGEDKIELVVVPYDALVLSTAAARVEFFVTRG